MLEEHLPDGRPSRARVDRPDVRQHVRRRQHHATAYGEQPSGLVTHRGVARQDHRDAGTGGGEASRVVQQHALLAAVGTAGQQDHVRACRRQLGPSGAIEAPGTHMHHPGPRGQRHPPAGLGADLPLVPDHRQPQAAAGAGAGERRGMFSHAQLRAHGRDTVEYVGV